MTDKQQTHPMVRAALCVLRDHHYAMTTASMIEGLLSAFPSLSITEARKHVNCAVGSKYTKLYTRQKCGYCGSCDSYFFLSDDGKTYLANYYNAKECVE